MKNIIKINSKTLLVISILMVLIFITFLLSLNMGSFSIEPMDVIKTFLGKGQRNHEIAIFKLRLPRIVIALLVLHYQQQV